MFFAIILEPEHSDHISLNCYKRLVWNHGILFCVGVVHKSYEVKWCKIRIDAINRVLLLTTQCRNLSESHSANLISWLFLSGGCSKLPPTKTRPYLQPRGRSDPSPAAQATAAGRTGRALPVTTRVVRKVAAAWGRRPSRTEQRLGSVLPAAQSRRGEHSSGSKTFLEINETGTCVIRSTC